MTLGTTGAFGFSDFPQPQFLSIYAAAGCTRVQVYRNPEKNLSAAEIVNICDSAGLTIDSLHAHFGDDLDPSSIDEPQRRRSVESYFAEADYCRQLGGDMMVIHPSPAHTPIGDAAKRASQLQKSIDEFAKLAEKTGVICAIENMPPYHPIGTDIGQLVDLIVGAGSIGVGFLLDFGHAHMSGDIATAIRRADKHLRFTHVHDNDGINDTHFLPYRGTLPWDKAREALHDISYDGVFMLEVFETVENLKMMNTDVWQRNVKSILR